MITQKPDDRLIRNFKVVVIIIGVCLVYAIYAWATIGYKMLSNGKINMPLIFGISMANLIFGIIGYFQFLSSGFKKSKLFRLYLLYNCFSNLTASFFYCYMFLSPRFDHLRGDRGILTAATSVFILCIADFVSLALLQKARVPKISIEQDGENNAYAFHPVSRGQRLIHRVLDVIVIVYIAGVYFVLYRYVLVEQISRYFLIVAEVALIFVYYFLMESIFKVTFGKIMTESMVVNEHGEKVKSARVLLRTLCRFIPFDALSFLFVDRGWHDRLSNTYVINDQYAWENDEDVLSTYFTGKPEEETTTTLIP